MAWSIAYLDGSIKLSKDELVNSFFNEVPNPEDIEQQSRFDLLELNLHKAQTFCENIYQSADDKGVVCKRVRLKVDGVNKFAAIIYVDEAGFNHPVFTQIQSNAANLLTRVNMTADFHISLTFLPDNIEVNDEKLVTEGYILSYNPLEE